MAANEFTVRVGNAADLPAVAAIQSAAPEAAQWDVQDYLGYEFRIVEASFPKIEIAGFAAWREVTTGEWELLNLAVSPAFRRRGVGALLVSKLLEKQPERVFLEVRESNIGAIGLYKCLHFTKVGVRRNYYSNPTENAIVLGFQK